SCLLTGSVAGNSRLPEPPARMMPLRVLMMPPEFVAGCAEPHFASLAIPGQMFRAACRYPIVN
ncbi:MAG: hypothetical protein OEY12_05015, partial [Nitrospira sp.]|nr:hypothetical protein [Nitrospira sp.]